MALQAYVREDLEVYCINKVLSRVLQKMYTKKHITFIWEKYKETVCPISSNLVFIALSLDP